MTMRRRRGRAGRWRIVRRWEGPQTTVKLGLTLSAARAWVWQNRDGPGLLVITHPHLPDEHAWMAGRWYRLDRVGAQQDAARNRERMKGLHYVD